MESLGFINFWGLTPAINVFKGLEDDIEIETHDEELNVLISECGGDGRHLFKTISDLSIEVEKPRT